ncbi:MAG: HDOD domain-containing protein, partial [Sulfurimonas sp.]|uniref:HDOD domain-containing protein n=1 Tax=Sulfurimonas sp. TaxID=2022749 RepID=UPI0028CD1CFA
ITSEEFAKTSSLQAALMFSWYRKIDRYKAEELYLAAFLQETGKILIASEVIQNDEAISFASEIENSNNIAVVEKAYSDATSGEVTALVFKHWGFDSNFIEMIKYSDNPSSAPDNIKECSAALNIVKTIVPVNKPFSDISINFGLKKAADAGYDIAILQEAISQFTDKPEE